MRVFSNNFKHKSFYSIRRMSVTDPGNNVGGRRQSNSQAAPKKYACDELLAHYQRQWQLLHQTTQSNAVKAEDISRYIFETSSCLKKQASSLREFDTLLSNVVQIESSIKNIENDLSVACSQLAHLEELINDRELCREVDEQNKLQLDAKYKLALYKERRVAEFEEFKSKAAASHALRVNECERLMKHKLQERQEAFDAAFKDDLNEYKQKGKVDKPSHTPSSTALEDIDVELDQKDKEALDQFLTDE